MEWAFEFGSVISESVVSKEGIDHRERPIWAEPEFEPSVYLPEVALNQQVKNLIQKLGEAIHESVSESEQIAGVVREIREQGFDVLLMLEATIGLNEVDEETEGEGTAAAEPAESGPFTRSDLSFLKSLRITTEEHSADSPGKDDSEG